MLFTNQRTRLTDTDQDYLMETSRIMKKVAYLERLLHSKSSMQSRIQGG